MKEGTKRTKEIKKKRKRIQEEDSAPSWRAQHTVALWCPWYTLISSPDDIDHSLAVVSEEAAKIHTKTTIIQRIIMRPLFLMSLRYIYINYLWWDMHHQQRTRSPKPSVDVLKTILSELGNIYIYVFHNEFTSSNTNLLKFSPMWTHQHSISWQCGQKMQWLNTWKKMAYIALFLVSVYIAHRN